MAEAGGSRTAAVVLLSQPNGGVIFFFQFFFPPFLAVPSYISVPLLFDSFPPLFGLFSLWFSPFFFLSVLSLSGLLPPLFSFLCSSVHL